MAVLRLKKLLVTRVGVMKHCSTFSLYSMLRKIVFLFFSTQDGSTGRTSLHYAVEADNFALAGYLILEVTDNTVVFP